MTKEKLKSIFVFYRDELNSWTDLPPKRFDDDQTKMMFSEFGPVEIIPHYKFMCEEAQKFVDEDRVEKAMRWLGFLQGAFWRAGIFSLDELKRHSMPV